jgi:hypothetical protein
MIVSLQDPFSGYSKEQQAVGPSLPKAGKWVKILLIETQQGA